MSSIPNVNTPAGAKPPETALDSYLRAVRAHKLLVAAVILVTLLASLAWIALRTADYKATAQLVVSPLSQADDTFLGLPVIRDSGDPTRTVQTAAALLDSPAAARATARRLGTSWSAQRVMSRVDVEPSGETDIVDVTARAQSGGEAILIANRFAAAAVAQRDLALRRALATVIPRLTRLRAGMSSSDPSASVLDSRIAELQEARLGGDPSTALSRSASSSSLVGPPSWLIVFLAVLAGAVLASGAALLTERLGPATIRAEDELGEENPLPILVRLPPSGSNSRRPAVVSGFRSLRLQLEVQKGSHRTILVTSPSTGDGRTTCLINLAAELASVGEAVVLLDLDLRRPELARRLGVEGEIGVSALAAGATLADALVPVPTWPTVSVVPGIADSSETMLEELGRRLPEVIAEARSQRQYVLIDTSPLGETGDALRFVRPVDDVLLVVRLNHSTLTGLETTRDLLLRAAKRPMGYIVLGTRDGQVPGRLRTTALP